MFDRSSFSVLFNSCLIWMQFLADGLNFAGPLLLHSLMTFLDSVPEKTSVAKGYWIAAALGLSSIAR
jgi:hypothetical protein